MEEHQLTRLIWAMGWCTEYNRSGDTSNAKEAGDAIVYSYRQLIIKEKQND